MIDQYVGYYTPTILMIAALVWVITEKLERVIAVLVMSCPCAIVLATPSAVIAAVAAASRMGILIKNVAHLELAAHNDKQTPRLAACFWRHVYRCLVPETLAGCRRLPAQGFHDLAVRVIDDECARAVTVILAYGNSEL